MNNKKKFTHGDIVVCPCFCDGVGEIVTEENNDEIILVDFHGFDGKMGIPCFVGHLEKIGEL